MLQIFDRRPTPSRLGAAQEGTLEKQTVPVLKGFCKEHGLPQGGKKDEVAKRVHAKLEAMAKEDANAVTA